MAMNEINIDREGRNICRNCVDKLRMGGKPEKLKKVGYITFYRTEESKEGEEEVEGTVLGDGDEYVIIVPVLYPRGTVSVLPLGSFCLLVLLLHLLILI